MATEHIAAWTGSFAELDDECVRAYQHSLTAKGFCPDGVAAALGVSSTRAAAIAATLREAKLLRADPRDGTLVPVSPEVAEAEFNGPLELDILRCQLTITRVQAQMRALLPVYREHDGEPGDPGGVRILKDPEDVRREIAAASRRCEHEVLTMQPGGGRSTSTLADAVARDLAMLHRGARMRTIYQHTARTSLATRSYVTQVQAAGARVRTTAEAFERLIIFDEAVAFVPTSRSGADAPGAALVTEPVLLGYMTRVFENVWSAASPFDAAEATSPETIDEVRSTILRLMALGMKDDVIARRVGMATRTVRRYITTMMEELAATSRFQAGVKAAQLGLVPPDEAGSGDDED
jgi:DNA-binding CsgD family transcriptional regulator